VPHLRHILPVTLALDLLCGSARAQDAQTVTTTTGNARGAAARTPARVDSLRADDLMRQGATDLASALVWIAGATPTSPTGTATGMIVDGLSASQVVVLRDGLPFARMSGSPDGPMADLSTIPIDPAIIERIDVYRGAGPGGTGGAGGVVIDIITRRSQQGYEAFVRSISGAAEVAAPWRQELTAGGNAQLSERWSAQLMAQRVAVDPIDVNGDDIGDNPERRRIGGEAAMQWRDGQESLRVGLVGSMQTTTASVSPTAPLIDQIDAGSARLRVQGRWWTADDMRLEHGSDVSVDQHDFAKIVRASGDTRPKADTTQYAARQTLLATWFLGDHDLQGELIGGVTHIQRGGETGTLDPITLGEGGAGVTDTWHVGERFELQGRVYGDVQSGFGAGWSGQIAAIWRASDTLAPRLTVSRSRRIPTPEERFLLFDHSEVGYRVLGNPDLTPESLRSVRAGLVITPTRRVQFEVEGFVHDLDDAIITTSAASGTATFTYVNAAGARTAGANASMRLVGLPGGLMLTASHAWLPLSEDDDGQPLALRAEHSTRAELRGRWLGGDLEAWCDVQARSALATPAASPAAPAYALLGAGVRWQALDVLSLNLDLNNLLNQTNATWGPVPGAHALLTLELRARSNNP
jgi:outer membrane receptor for ferrienterochelin and colicins